MLFLAIRHLLSRKRQTVLVLLGIALGTMMFLVIAGVQKGMQDTIIQMLLNNTPHVEINAHEEEITPETMGDRFFGPGTVVDWIVPPSGRRDEEHIEYPQGWFDRLDSDPRVLGYSPGLALSAILKRGDVRLPAQLFGIIPDQYQRMTRVESYMREGSLMDLVGGGSKILLGSELRERLGAAVGDTIQVSIGESELLPVKVAGYFKLGVEEVDRVLAYIALQDAQRLNRTPGRIDHIMVNLVDPEDAQEVAAEWQVLSRERVRSWQENAANFLQVISIQNLSRMIITFAILIVAAFGIYNVLSIMVNQKKREIAILRAVGFPPNDILELFLIQGVLLGVGGAIVGIALGHLANVWIGSIELGFETPMGNRLVISYSLSNYLTGFALAFLSAIAASYLPARAASRLTPLDIIRSES